MYVSFRRPGAVGGSGKTITCRTAEDSTGRWNKRSSECLHVIIGPRGRKIPEAEPEDAQSPSSPALVGSIRSDQRSRGTKEINTMG